MIKIYLLLVTVIALLLYGIYKQSEVEKLESEVTALKKENNIYKKHIAETEDKMNALKGKLSYLNIEAQSLQSDIEFIKLNPASWSIAETGDYLQQLQSGIAEAKNESE
jgi:predicted  nucleic acid-binding Zn-ribbon protein